MSEALPLPPRPNLEQYKKLAEDLQSQRDAERIARRWNQLRDTNENAARCALAGAQFFIAREHGFESGPKFARHVRELARSNSPIAAEHPGLAHERSTRDHRSTLLHYVSANGVEDYRQKTPKNIVAIANLLLDARAEVDAPSDAYGGGCTPLALVATSVHPEKAGIQLPLLQTLLDRGADFRRPGIAGNRHSIVHGCIANGQPAAAKFLADLGAPVDLESAAALGRLDVLDALFPTADPKQLASALRYACGYGSVPAIEFLLERGAPADPRMLAELRGEGLY
jgi:ankyrin repeat protein